MPDDDPAWQWATESLRAKYRAEAARIAMLVWKEFRAQGLDRDGRLMADIGPGTVVARTVDVNRVTALQPYSPMGRASAEHAPLQATGPKSRTQTLLRCREFPEGLWFYWGFDRHTGWNWGAILDRHRRGFTQYFRYPPPAHFARVPSRDVFGFSPPEVRLIGSLMERWWSARRGSRVATRVSERPLAVLSVTIPERAKGLAPQNRRWKPEPLPSFTTITAKVSAVGSGGQELGAGTRIARFKIGNKAPSWMTGRKR